MKQSEGVWASHQPTVDGLPEAEGFAGRYDPTDPDQVASLFTRLDRFYDQLGYSLFIKIDKKDLSFTYKLQEVLEDPRSADPVVQTVKFSVDPIKAGQYVWTSYVTGLTIGVEADVLNQLTIRGSQLEDPNQFELDLGL